MSNSENKNPGNADSCTILIIDDDWPTCDALSRMITGYSAHQVLCATDGRKGLDMIRQNKPDMVILDIHMPQPDGLHVLEAIKKNPETQQIPVIMLTGQDCQKNLDASMYWYADAYLTKPCDRKTLMDAVSSTLSRRCWLGTHGGNLCVKATG